MKLSDYVIDSLEKQGVTHIFEVCGGALAHLLDSVYDKRDITTVSMHHENAASFAAEGYARAGGNIGVAMATSGPGATNLITGIGSCYFDSIPCLFITGQVNTYEYKGEQAIRQIGFQETDIVSIVKPITKNARMVKDEKDIRYILGEAYTLARTGRPGPVLIDLPLNIQRADIDVNALPAYADKPETLNYAELQGNINKICDLIQTATRPVILMGGGVRAAHACEELYTFATKTGIPIVSTLMGLDSFPHTHKQYVGMIGTYGNRYANLTIANSDLIIALGTRFDTRQTGTRPDTFARNAKIVHIDIDKLELNAKLKVAVPVLADIRYFLHQINGHKLVNNSDWYCEWSQKIEGYKKQYPDYLIPIKKAIDPNYLFHLLSKELADDAVICVDVGQIQMWAAQSIELKKSQRFLTEGGMAAIGSAVPMAIGAAFAKPNTQVIAVVGDGGFQLNIQELQTIYHYQLPVKIILLNNNGYGMIKQFQEQYMNSRFQSSGVGYSNPDFQKVVSAYKITAMKISENSEIALILRQLLSDKEPGFLEVVIDPSARATPKLSVNRPIEDQDPLLSREELKKDMIIDILPEPK